MFAVVKTGGKQYKVAVDDVLKFEKLDAEVGQVVDLNNILLVGGEGAKLASSASDLKGAVVKAKILEQKRDKKVIIFKKKRRKNHRRKNGHRQSITIVKIVEISCGGSSVKSDKKEAAPKKAAPKKATTEAKKEATPKKETATKAKASTAKKATTKTAAKSDKPKTTATKKKAAPKKKEEE